MRFLVEDMEQPVERTTALNARCFAQAADMAEGNWPGLRKLRLVLISDANAKAGPDEKPSLWQRVRRWFR